MKIKRRLPNGGLLFLLQVCSLLPARLTSLLEVNLAFLLEVNLTSLLKVSLCPLPQILKKLS